MLRVKYGSTWNAHKRIPPAAAAKFLTLCQKVCKTHGALFEHYNLTSLTTSPDPVANLGGATVLHERLAIDSSRFLTQSATGQQRILVPIKANYSMHL